MAKIKNKQELISKIKNAEGFSNEEKSQMLALLNESKTYGLVWENSTEDAWEMMKDYVPVLKEDESKRIDHGSENPNHILIEGDNLNALTALSYTHDGNIDVIYIDPPYNTGNKDFAYYDDFCDEYRQIPYVDKEDSYRHSKWISFMKKRLKIAKQLLSNNGVIFVSINNIELAQLKLIMDQEYGENNFVGHLIWESTTQPINAGKAKFQLQQKTESILCYAKNKEKKDTFILKEIDTGLKYPHMGKLGMCRFEIIEKSDAGSYNRETMKFPILGQYPRNGKRWQIGEDTAVDLVKRDRIEIVDGIVKKAVYPEDEIDKRKFEPFWSLLKADEVGTAQKGKDELNTIMGTATGFDTVKSLGLMESILSHFNRNSIILDFFAGSGTTLNATMQLNEEDGGNRQCILVTNNENNICEKLTYERNKRVIEGYTKPNGEFVEGLKDNNLRYFKVGFTPREKTDENMFRLAKNSVNLLRIKHDVYKEKQFGVLENPYKRYRYFEEDGKQLLVILDTELIGDIVEQLEEMEVSKPIPTYVFTTGAYPFTEDFESVADKVELYPLPHGIYQACERNMPKMTDKEIENPEGISLSNEELETSMDDLTKEEA